MDLPTFLPTHLNIVGLSKSEDDLFETLSEKMDNLVTFFEVATDDEIWTETHDGFITRFLNFVTEQSYFAQIANEYVMRIARTIRHHYSVLKSKIPKNITLKLKDKEVRENSLLLVAASEYFRHMLIKECRDKESHVLSIVSIEMDRFSPISSYINTGLSPEILTMGQEELINLIELVERWQIKDLSILAQERLSKYVTKDNIIAMITMARQRQWLPLAEHIATYINQRDFGFKLKILTLDRLAFEFYESQNESIKYFENLRKYITDLTSHGQLAEHPLFGEMVKESPDLIGIDISRTASFHNNFPVLPKKLREINLSECPWLTKETLSNLAEICVDIEEITLTSNTHLKSVIWGVLLKFKNLKRLSLAHCHQIVDTDLAIIVKGCPYLTYLSLENCQKISDQGFASIGKNLNFLNDLDLSRCSLTDNGLVEICSRCSNLTHLDISHCENLTDKGLISLAKISTKLKEVNILRCHFTENARRQVGILSPNLTLFFR